MFSHTKKLFIFDIDGTLVNSYTAIEKSLNFTLRKFNLATVSYQKVKHNVGRGDKLFIETFFPKKYVKDALKIYRAHHKKSLYKYSRLMPRADQLLLNLKKRKILIAAASNRPRYFTNILLVKLKIKRYFDYVLCADQIKSLKPNPKILNRVVKKFNLKKKEAIFIGDMDIDLETAHRARIDAMFVRGGSSTLASVKKYKNKKIISSLTQVLRQR